MCHEQPKSKRRFDFLFSESVFFFLDSNFVKSNSISAFTELNGCSCKIIVGLMRYK